MKKYQIFVSSTYKDLKNERLEAIKTILECDCIPCGMEAFSSDGEEQFEVIKQVINLCDYYILIIGNRYGSIHHETNLSFTEMEFDYAIERNIPVLVFMKKDYCDESKVDNLERLTAFAKKVSNNHLVSFWSNKDELAKKISLSLFKSLQKNDRKGWVKGDELDEISSLNEKLDQENSELKKKLSQVEEKYNDIKNQIDQITTPDGDLMFNEEIEIPYKTITGSHYTKTATLKQIFKSVSIEFLNVTWKEDSLLHFINDSLDVYKVDGFFAKRICNHFLALNLMYTKWVEGKGLFYGLTVKGEKIRNELNLFIKKK